MTIDAPHRGGRGEAMLLVHGFTDTWRAWTPVRAPIWERALHHQSM